MLREGDKLVVTKLDRLARSVAHMGDTGTDRSQGCWLGDPVLGYERVDTSTATGKLILNMMVSVAQFEREMMKERQVEGIRERKLRVSTKVVFPKLCNKRTRLRR